jgi:hypothetical protein
MYTILYKKTLKKMENTTLSFSTSSQPDQKKFSLRRVVSVVRKIGNVAGRVSDIAGKVALVASVI